MAVQCPACSKTNPAEAIFCFYDGRPLSQAGAEGPLQIGAMPFPMPFCFSNGQGCANFNQLALACDERWEEARGLLVDGIWPSFFSAIGWLDLVVAAKQAAKEPDPDVGLSQLLEKFPADPNALRMPKLALMAAEEDLGTLAVGVDHTFELRISNQGMLVLRGMVMTDCDWLSFGEGAASLRMFQTRSIFTMPVRVLGHKLRAGQKPLEGSMVIDTNGGSVTLPVRAHVPVQPFPKGQYANDVLAGAKSPHEVAVKAKAHPQEAAVLFEQGAVKAWYASNGWTYPIQGTEGTGKGAVQQFFEALGLTKPPKLEISAGRILCKGRPGRKLTKQVTISTKEARPVYAQAWSNQPWLQPKAARAQGNTITIPLQIEVPRRPGEVLHADVTFQGNGKQRFVVPVSLSVVDAAAQAESDDDEAEATGGLSAGWIFAIAAVLLVAGAAALGFVLNRPGDEAPQPLVAPIANQPPPPKDDGTWWESYPNSKLPALAAAFKQIAPRDRGVIDGISVKSDVDRYKSYEQLAAKLPELTRDAKIKEPLGRFVTECCVFEPLELNVAPLRRALTGQVVREGAAFAPEEKGAEVERALWSLHVLFEALTHPSIAAHPGRAAGLANELGTVFGFALDISAPPDQLKPQTAKLLAVRCYRNTLPTAAKALDHALSMRGKLKETFPQLDAVFCAKIDVDLVVTGLAQGSASWPKVESIIKNCLDNNDLTTNLKLIGYYGEAKPDVALRLEEMLAAKWKPAADPKLTQTDKAAHFQKMLIGAAARAKITPAQRLAQLQKLTTSALGAVGKTPKKDAAILQNAVRLAHASTMAADLLHPEIGLERFDEFAARVPEIDQTEADKTADAKQPDGSAKQPAAKTGIPVGAQPKVVQGTISQTSERDPVRNGALCKSYSFALNGGQIYTIDLMARFDAFLRLENPQGVHLASDDDSGQGTNSRIVFQAPVSGAYRVIASSLSGRNLGAFTLQVQQGGLGGLGLGAPGGLGIGGLGLGGLGGFGKLQPAKGKKTAAPGMLGGAAPAQTSPAGNDKKDSPLSTSDLAELESKQSNVRAAAFNSLAGSLGNDLAPRYARVIAKYLLVVVQPDADLDEVTPKLAGLTKCRSLLLALADQVGVENTTIAQKTAETVIGGVLGRPLQFARDEDWRSACRKLLLQRALDLTGTASAAAEQAAELLRDLYKEQGLAFAIDDLEFLEQTRPALVLQSVIKHVAGQAANKRPLAEDKAYLEQLDRQLRAAQFVADNDLEHLVLVQRIWLRVLVIYLRPPATAQAKAMADLEQALLVQDRQAGGLLEQLRDGEAALLRVWALAHHFP